MIDYLESKKRECNSIGCGKKVWDACIVNGFCVKHCECPENRYLKQRETSYGRVEEKIKKKKRKK